jgi:ankyrin repeat protein
MPTRHLPQAPDLDHLKYQARDLLADRVAGEPGACQRIREFHPRFHSLSDAQIQAAQFSLSDAYLAIAREYGFASWARLRAQVSNGADLDRPQHERIEDPVFRLAVGLVDDADVAGLRNYLSEHPQVVHQRVAFEGDNYFRNPSLLEFIAENPIRHGSLSSDVVDIATVILEAGARTDQAALDSTLALVCSGCVPRECGVQIPLIRLLCRYGANAAGAMSAATSHGEFEAAEELQRRGAQLDLTAAAAMGRVDVFRQKLGSSLPEARHIALALACQHGRVEIVKLLMDAGEDPNRYNPVGFHAHSTPLHQAAFAGHFDVVQMLVEGGARLGLKDIHYDGTAADWAEYAGRHDIAEYLRSRGRSQTPL